MADDETNEKPERPEFYATQSHAVVIDAIPGNYDAADGPPVAILTLARGDQIEPFAFPLAEAKAIVTKLLIAMATKGDDFAMKLLDDHFSADEDGNFIWPTDSDEPWR